VPGDGQVIKEARVWFFVRMSNDNAVAWTEYVRMADALALEPSLKASVYNFKYEFAYCDLMMPLFGLKNLVMAAGTIFAVVYLFLPFSIALLSTFTVVCIDVILLGLISVTGMSLNTITLVTLLLALALAIDYSCHIGHAYVVAAGRTRKEKAAQAIADIGFSIINAAGSTLLGTLFLAASQSPVFRIFFLLIWSTIFLGARRSAALRCVARRGEAASAPRERAHPLFARSHLLLEAAAHQNPRDPSARARPPRSQASSPAWRSCPSCSR
jgi:hypothetical protein